MTTNSRFERGLPPDLRLVCCRLRVVRHPVGICRGAVAPGARAFGDLAGSVSRALDVAFRRLSRTPRTQRGAENDGATGPLARQGRSHGTGARAVDVSQGALIAAQNIYDDEAFFAGYSSPKAR